MVMDGLFPYTGLTFQVRKVMVGGCVASRIIVSAPFPVPFLWTMEFGFGTWFWDLDLGLSKQDLQNVLDYMYNGEVREE